MVSFFGISKKGAPDAGRGYVQDMSTDTDGYMGRDANRGDPKCFRGWTNELNEVAMGRTTLIRFDRPTRQMKLFTRMINPSINPPKVGWNDPDVVSNSLEIVYPAV